MQGYLRRKVTYNLGSRSKSGSKPNQSDTLGDKVGLGFINPLGKSELATEQAVIFDDNGFVHSEWEYCLLGEREGWLIRTGGMHTGNRGIVYHHFLFVPRE